MVFLLEFSHSTVLFRCPRQDRLVGSLWQLPFLLLLAAVTSTNSVLITQNRGTSLGLLGS